jgi:enoyl-[acyl-carrier-protein] reductase (NADH)
VYISDAGNQRIRKVTVSTGIISTFAGTGTGSYSGDNDLATSATLNAPRGVWVDTSGTTIYYSHCFGLLTLFLFLGNVYIADAGNNRIRKVTVSTGIISTFAGTGTGSYSGDNDLATSATLNAPTGVAVDSSGTRLH